MFQIDDNVTASISGLTISKGFCYYAAVDDLGSLTLTGCTLSDNVGVGNAGGVGGKATPGGGSLHQGLGDRVRLRVQRQ